MDIRECDNSENLHENKLQSYFLHKRYPRVCWIVYHELLVGYTIDYWTYGTGLETSGYGRTLRVIPEVRFFAIIEEFRSTSIFVILHFSRSQVSYYRQMTV